MGGEHGCQGNVICLHGRDEFVWLDRIDSCSLFGALVNQQVHVVVGQSWEELDGHVTQIHCGVTHSRCEM